MSEASHTLLVFDPWDMEITNGSNPFFANSVGVLPGPNLPNWQGKLFLLNVLAPFLCEGEPVSQILCSPRYKGDPMFLARYASCTVGISRVRPGYLYTEHSSVHEAEIDYFAIGEIRKHGRFFKGHSML
ncbi:MAG: hypothetical protein OEU84_11110 [Xanthomonadales bacterium]|nr:hypothetical protein [Xanthomonadales bacterium]MDH4020139.1 hypothetical protein [Xanthomonadales bacterium]